MALKRKDFVPAPGVTIAGKPKRKKQSGTHPGKRGLTARSAPARLPPVMPDSSVAGLCELVSGELFSVGTHLCPLPGELRVLALWAPWVTRCLANPGDPAVFLSCEFLSGRNSRGDTVRQKRYTFLIAGETWIVLDPASSLVRM